MEFFILYDGTIEIENLSFEESLTMKIDLTTLVTESRNQASEKIDVYQRWICSQ